MVSARPRIDTAQGEGVGTRPPESHLRMSTHGSPGERTTSGDAGAIPGPFAAGRYVVHRLRLLYDLGCAFAARTELDELIPFVIRQSREVLGAEGASVLLIDEDGSLA